MKKNIFRAIAILACLCILSLAIPSSVFAEKKVEKFSFRFLERPTFLVFSVFPFFSPIYDTEGIYLPDTNKSTFNKVKLAGEGVVKPKPPDEDGG